MATVPCTLWHRPVTSTFVSVCMALQSIDIGSCNSENRVWAVFLDIPANVQHQRDIAQSAENAGDAARIADVDIDAELHGDLNIIAPDVDPAVEDRTQNAVRTGKRLRAACVGVIVACVPMAALIFLTAAVIRSSRSGSVSISASSQSAKAGNESRSRTRLRVKIKLPAPINANFFIKSTILFHFEWFQCIPHLRGSKAENCQISGHSCYTASRPYAILARGDQHESLL